MPQKIHSAHNQAALNRIKREIESDFYIIKHHTLFCSSMFNYFGNVVLDIEEVHSHDPDSFFLHFGTILNDLPGAWQTDHVASAFHQMTRSILESVTESLNDECQKHPLFETVRDHHLPSPQWTIEMDTKLDTIFQHFKEKQKPTIHLILYLKANHTKFKRQSKPHILSSVLNNDQAFCEDYISKINTLIDQLTDLANQFEDALTEYYKEYFIPVKTLYNQRTLIYEKLATTEPDINLFFDAESFEATIAKTEDLDPEEKESARISLAYSLDTLFEDPEIAEEIKVYLKEKHKALLETYNQSS